MTREPSPHADDILPHVTHVGLNPDRRVRSPRLPAIAALRTSLGHVRTSALAEIKISDSVPRYRTSTPVRLEPNNGNWPAAHVGANCVRTAASPAPREGACTAHSADARVGASNALLADASVRTSSSDCTGAHLGASFERDATSPDTHVGASTADRAGAHVGAIAHIAEAA